MKLAAAGVLVLLALTITCRADDLKEFSSDGCSSFPDGTFEQQELWRSCCVVHDIAYWKGGSRAERRVADEALRVCVAKVGEPNIARLMLAGVRVGGTPWLPTKFRWAYGWPYLRGYQRLSEEEAILVKKKLQAARAMLQQESVATEPESS